MTLLAFLGMQAQTIYPPKPRSLRGSFLRVADWDLLLVSGGGPHLALSKTKLPIMVFARPNGFSRPHFLSLASDLD